MSHQFKPGDLAMIICGPISGCVVELVSFHTSGLVMLASGLASKVAEPEWLVTGSGLTARFGAGEERYPVKDGLIPPRFLMPLRGDFAPEQAKSREVSV